MNKVVIVDHDPMVSFINREYIERDPRFKVAGEFQNGRDALAYLKSNPADLMVLDLCLPEYSGIALIRDILSSDIEIQLIVVTASKDKELLAEALRLGVIDYLVKPFSYKRLQKALDKYLDFKHMLDGMLSVEQDAINYLMDYENTQEAGTARMKENAAYERILACFEESRGHGFTAGELAQKLQLTTVTVRRYLKHLNGMGRIVGEVDYHTGGHPKIVYRMP